MPGRSTGWCLSLHRFPLCRQGWRSYRCTLTCHSSPAGRNRNSNQSVQAQYIYWAAQSKCSIIAFRYLPVCWMFVPHASSSPRWGRSSIWTWWAHHTHISGCWGTLLWYSAWQWGCWLVITKCLSLDHSTGPVAYSYRWWVMGECGENKERHSRGYMLKIHTGTT